MSMVKRIEGMVIKRIIGISKHCHSTLIYYALKMHKTHDTIGILQYKLLLRIQNNDYIEEFLVECRKERINSGLIGKIINKLDLAEESDLNEINET